MTRAATSSRSCFPRILRSPPAVTKAVDALKKNGTLAELQKKWLSEAVNVPPVLK